MIPPQEYKDPYCSNGHGAVSMNFEKRESDGVRVFRCPQCGRVIRINESSLNRVPRKGEEPLGYENPHCSNGHGAVRMKQERRSPNGVRRYRCPRCNRAFKITESCLEPIYAA